MGKISGPGFIIIAAVSSAFVWKFAPALGQRLPLPVQTNILTTVQRCLGRQPDRSEEEVRQRERDDLAAEKRRFAEAAARPSNPRAGKGRMDNPELDELLVKPVNPEDLPSTRGILPADPRTAAWGVLNLKTPVTQLDGETMGTVDGGRFFVIESRMSTDKGLLLVGNFTPNALRLRVSVPAENLSCFTGSPDTLTDLQKRCLRTYYQLRAEAEAYKAKLVRRNAEKSPYFVPAANALTAFRAKAREVEALKNPDEDQKRAVTYELSQLKQKVQELNEKHRMWKGKHAAQLPDPAKDARYLKLVRDRMRYAAPIAGLAF